jgi:hypothetical protein
MLEYFTYKKVKQRQDAKKAMTPTATPPVASPLLSEEDEGFLERMVSEGTPPPLPERSYILNPEVGDSTGNDAQVVVHDEPVAKPENQEKGKGKGKGKEKAIEKTEDGEKKKEGRFAFIARSVSRRV